MKSKEERTDRRLLYHSIQKVKRTFTAFLPVEKNRQGECVRCGECCKMGWACPFLKYVEDDGKKLAACGIRHIRPMNCRSYPRIKSEQLVFPCGYCFENGARKKESKP